ncbi:MAG: CinA family protein [Collinsella sp.]|nr:CinA family protein [Collinsella sp.]
MPELDERAHALAEELVGRATRSGVAVATAESCTAGMVASLIAGVPGASAVLKGGAVTYTDEIKRDVLGVSGATLAAHTAVSAACAEEMAIRAAALFEADLAVSLTGYAGPGGGTAADPAGTVYIGIRTPRGASVERHVFSGSRNAVRLQAAVRALELLVAAV